MEPVAARCGSVPGATYIGGATSTVSTTEPYALTTAFANKGTIDAKLVVEDGVSADARIVSVVTTGFSRVVVVAMNVVSGVAACVGFVVGSCPEWLLYILIIVPNPKGEDLLM